MSQRVLFNGESLRDWFARRQKNALKELQGWPAEEIRFNPDAVASTILEKYRVEPLAMDLENLSYSGVEEANVETARYG